MEYTYYSIEVILNRHLYKGVMKVPTTLVLLETDIAALIEKRWPATQNAHATLISEEKYKKSSYDKIELHVDISIVMTAK